MAIKNQLESSGNAFESAEHLINAAFSVQREQERRSRLENLNPSGATLTNLGEGEGRSRSERVELANLLGEEIRMEVEEEIGSTVSLTPRSPATSTTTSSSSTSAAVPAPGNSATTSSSSTSNSQQEQELASISAELRELAASSNIKNANSTSPTSSAPSSPKDDLESENARLKEQRTCKICMDGEVGVVFLPCGHLCSCVLCAPSLRDCPVCRTNIQGTVRTFLS